MPKNASNSMGTGKMVPSNKTSSNKATTRGTNPSNSMAKPKAMSSKSSAKMPKFPMKKGK